MQFSHYFEARHRETVMIIDAFTISGFVMSLVMSVVVFYLIIHNQPHSDHD